MNIIHYVQGYFCPKVKDPGNQAAINKQTFPMVAASTLMRSGAALLISEHAGSGLKAIISKEVPILYLAAEKIMEVFHTRLKSPAFDIERDIFLEKPYARRNFFELYHRDYWPWNWNYLGQTVFDSFKCACLVDISAYAASHLFSDKNKWLDLARTAASTAMVFFVSFYLPWDKGAPTGIPQFLGPSTWIPQFHLNRPEALTARLATAALNLAAFEAYSACHTVGFALIQKIPSLFGKMVEACKNPDLDLPHEM